MNPRKTAVIALWSGAVLGGAHVSAAQQPEARRDSGSTRADYRDLNELLAKLPGTKPPAFDASRALSIGALPLACLDRMQPRPGGRGPARPPTAGDSTSARDSAGRARGAPPSAASAIASPAPTNNSGAGYFWVPTYSVVPDHGRTRAFWGCNDWQSAVASTWAVVHHLRRFPNNALETLSREKLNAHLGAANLEGELEFFKATARAINPIPSASQGGLFQRPYGFAWLLTLHAELRAWPDSQARRWAGNTAPLARWMADSLGAYFNKLVEPVRTGAQTNTAHNLLMALDYANAVGDARLRPIVISTAQRFFAHDTTCATQSERVTPLAGAGGGRAGGRGANAGGTTNNNPNSRGAATDSASRAPLPPNDLSAPGRGGAAAPAGGGGANAVISPCLTEAALMARVLDADSYSKWLNRFLPPLQSARFAPLTDTISIPTLTAGSGSAADTGAVATANAAARTERARLAGLSFARAQSLVRIAKALPARDPRVPVLRQLADIHGERGYQLMKEDTSGLTWLPAQAFMYEAVKSR